MASSAGGLAAASLPHRAVASIRTTGGSHHGSPVTVTGGGGGGGGGGSSSNPQTPLRAAPSAFGSPSSLRAEDDTIVVEFGARRLRVGFAGEPAPRGTVGFGPEQQRRVGDFRAWQATGSSGSGGGSHSGAAAGGGGGWRREEEEWGRSHELWRLDVRGLDLGLVGDKMERALREAFTKHLLIDSRPRKIVAVLPSAVPIPLLSTALDTLFARFQSPYVSLLSAPVACAAAAGVRAALVVDLGWAETVVTSVYEYREVGCSRTVRGGRMLVGEVHALLARALRAQERQEQHEQGQQRQESNTGAGNTDNTGEDAPPTAAERVVSFEECEEVATRLVWCRKAADPPGDETQDPSSTISTSPSTTVTIPLKSTHPPTTLHIPHAELSEPCERTFFSAPSPPPSSTSSSPSPSTSASSRQYAPASWDDHELPLPLLIFQHLLRLPLDVRALCMARVVFTGGCAAVLGLRGRVFDELARLVTERGWDPVVGRAAEKVRANPKLKRRPAGGAAAAAAATTGGGSTSPTRGEGGGGGGGGGATTNGVQANNAPPPQTGVGEERDGVWHDAATAAANSATTTTEIDPVEEAIQRSRDTGSTSNNKPQIHGELRAVDSLGAWAGASLLTQLKVQAVATVDRELWAHQGPQGASRPSEVDLKALQRQSVAAGGLMRSAAAATTAAAGGGGAGAAAGGGGGGGGTGSNWTLGVWGTV